MPDKGGKKKKKAAIKDNNDQLGENAFEQFTESYDNKGTKGKARK